MAGKGKIDNLKSLGERTTDEQRMIAKKGGIASGKARKENKMFRETLETILSMPMKNGESMDIDDIQNFAAIKGQNISVQEAILIAQVQKAMKGDTKAAEYLRDTAGQKPSDKVQLDTGVNIDDTINRIDSYLKGRAKHEEEIS